MILPMTIRTRNRILFFLMFISMTLILGLGIISTTQHLTGKFTEPDAIPAQLLQRAMPFRFHFMTVIMAIFILLIYAFINFLYINVEFEKTQSTKIIYFAVYLIGCLAESARLCVPLMNLWHSSSLVASLCSRIVLFGRTIAPLSLLFAVVYNDDKHRQDIEQNLVILLIVSIVIAKIIPLNTAAMLPVCRFGWGGSALFTTMRYIIIVVTAISQILLAIQSNVGSKYPYGFLLLAAGYMILCDTYCPAEFVAGTAAIISGTFIYLKNLHRMYFLDDAF
ncbi:MAG: hypothetical protein K2H09_09570 [Treponemataceae bacterium]|nr:hypothetical protein [Treponemataceae bacterium]